MVIIEEDEHDEELDSVLLSNGENQHQISMANGGGTHQLVPSSPSKFVISM
jgi:hypothetical protein